MAERAGRGGQGGRAASAAALRVEDLHVYYGQSHALQGVTLDLPSGVLSVVGRNGMGKTTLCKAIVGLTRVRSGSVRVAGREVTGAEPHAIHRLGVGYVPQGRRCWPSLSVDEHLRLAAGARRDAAWTPERVYSTFPRLAERRANGGAQLSGGEQQMLAIGRALLSDPALLIMDEPTEGLAPVIVAQVEAMLVDLAAEGGMSILVIEQNIGVATAVADRVAIMVNGRVERVMDAASLAGDRALQQRLLGVGRQAEDEPAPTARAEAREGMARVYRVERGGGGMAGGGGAPGAVGGYAYAPVTAMPNRWGLPAAPPAAPPAAAPAEAEPPPIPLSERIGRIVLVAGTFDTKSRELRFLVERVRAAGLPVRTVDLSTSGKPSTADVTPAQVAAMARGGAAAVMTGERGASVTAMAEAFARWIARERGIGGIVSAGGSGGTSMATAGMRALPFGVPKVMVSTVAAGDVTAYVGATDVTMMHAVADVQGLNPITETVLSNAAHAVAGMVSRLPDAEARAARARHARPALGLTMFGVTTPLVQAVAAALEPDYDCLVFHATGTGGRAMERLADDGMLAGMLDLTTTEVADMVAGGVFAATSDRFGAAIRTRLPYVGSVGACDMVNFGPRASVPERYAGRAFVVHNAAVTLMRTTPGECRAIGDFIGARLAQMAGPVRFLLPEGGVSALDAPGGPFRDPEADAALFEAIEAACPQTARRRVLRVPAHANDPAFAEAAVAAFAEIAPKLRRRA